MTHEPIFSLLDPVADLQASITVDEARQALALCMQFFLVSSAAEFEQLRDAIDTLVEQDPYLGEPLRLLYRRIAQESAERLSFAQIVEEWMASQGTAMRAVAIEPEQWRVSLRSGADTTSVRVERGWDLEADEVTIIITTPNGEKVEV
jgi:hypothetical protein